MVPKAGKVSIIVAQPCQAPPEISPRVIPLCAATLTLHDGRRFMKGANFGFTSSSGGNLVGFWPPPATLKHKHWNVRCAPLMLYQPRYRSQFNAAGGERMTMGAPKASITAVRVVLRALRPADSSPLPRYRFRPCDNFGHGARSLHGYIIYGDVKGAATRTG